MCGVSTINTDNYFMKSIYLTISVILLSSLGIKSNISTDILSVKYTELKHKNNDNIMRTSDVYVINNSDYKVTAIVQRNEYWAGTSKKTEYTFHLKPRQEKYAGQAHTNGYGSPGGIEWTIRRDYKGWK